MLSHLSPAPLGVGWAYFLPLSTQTWENLMSVIKLRSRGMLGQRKADLGLKAAQRKKTTHTDIFDSSKIPKGCDSQNPSTNGKYRWSLKSVHDGWCIHSKSVSKDWTHKPTLWPVAVHRGGPWRAGRMLHLPRTQVDFPLSWTIVKKLLEKKEKKWDNGKFYRHTYNNNPRPTLRLNDFTGTIRTA